MISVSTAVTIHKILIIEFGGSSGVRDASLMESALARPFQTFDGTDLYPSIYLKGAALLESILINHPFIDGNKRSAFVLTATILEESSLLFQASEDELYAFIIYVINTRPSIDTISAWIEQNTIEI